MTVHIAGETYTPLCGAGSGRECAWTLDAAQRMVDRLGGQVCQDCAEDHP